VQKIVSIHLTKKLRGHVGISSRNAPRSSYVFTFNDFEPVILFGKPQSDLPSSVRRAVVVNDASKSFEGLLSNRLETIRQIVLGVVRRNDYRNVMIVHPSQTAD
jgi:hypothetical protein